MFVSENLNAREQSAEGTTDFLKQQLEDAKRNLDDQDGRLADFQRKNLGRLPEQESGNANTLQALTTRLDAATQAVSRQQQDESFLEAMVAEQSQTSSHVDTATGNTPTTLQAQTQDGAGARKGFRGSLYAGPSGCRRQQASDCQSGGGDCAQTTAPVKDETTVSSSDSPQLKQLKLQLRAVKMSAAEAKQEQAAIEQQVKNYEAKIEASPLVEEEYKAITRDHETALQFYNTLLAKMNDSTMATALEHRQQGEQFRVMDAPNLPEEPSYPNRRIFGGGGLAAGLALGLLIAGLLEYRDTSIRNEADIWAFTKLPTLAVVSYIGALENPPSIGLRGRLKKLFSRTPKPMESARV